MQWSPLNSVALQGRFLHSSATALAGVKIFYCTGNTCSAVATAEELTVCRLVPVLSLQGGDWGEDKQELDLVISLVPPQLDKVDQICSINLLN